LAVTAEKVQKDLRVLKNGLRGLRLRVTADELSLVFFDEIFISLAEYLIELWGKMRGHVVKYARRNYLPEGRKKKVRLARIEDLGLEVLIDVTWTGRYFKVLDVEFVNPDTDERLEVD